MIIFCWLIVDCFLRFFGKIPVLKALAITIANAAA
jgi:hypothetical protein